MSLQAEPQLPKGRQRALCRRVVAFTIFTFASLLSYVLLNDPIEHNIFKGKYLHEFWIQQGSQAKLQDSIGMPLLVFQHIPRTAGDAMETHLFRDSRQIRRADPWPQHLPAYDKSFLFDEDVSAAANFSVNLISGYFSTDDLKRINRSKKVFVFLRHPVERVLSLYHWVGPKLLTQGRRNVQLLSAEEFVGHPGRPYSCSFTLNSMTYQLGAHQFCGRDEDRSKPISYPTPPERVNPNTTALGRLRSGRVLTRAKKALEEAAFVGFYETLEEDFWELRRQIFPDVDLPFYVPLAFWFATVLALPRLRVLRFMAEHSAEELEVIKQKLQLDLELWDWAVKKFKPGMALYPTYTSYFLANLPSIAIILLICFLACRCIAWWTCRPCESRPSVLEKRYMSP